MRAKRIVATSEPLLLIGFNRPDNFAALISRLREIEPSRIYVAIDGPRPGNSDDAIKVAQCRDLVSEIDWSAKVEVNFQEANLGCGLGVSTALNWFFAHEERGIILEDDILPQPTLFDFCSELLERYADDERVLAISGCNFVPPDQQSFPECSYRFSRVPHIWGWATWRRSWDLYRFTMTDWSSRLPNSRLWKVSGRSPAGFVFWRSIFDLMARQQVDTWDMQLVFEGMVRDMWTATCNVNLVDNVGFGEAATHTERRPQYLRASENLAFPLSHPPVAVDEKADAWSRRVVFEATTKGLVGQGLRYIRQLANSPRD